MVENQITQEIVIAAPVERIWAALTEAEGIRQWFASQGAEIDLRPGGALVMRWAEEGTTHARIEQIDPMRSFSFRWALTNDEQPDAGNSTLVEFSLAPDASGTRLQVVETGFRELATAEDEQVRHLKQNTEGWREVFADLADYLQRVPA